MSMFLKISPPIRTYPGKRAFTRKSFYLSAPRTLTRDSFYLSSPKDIRLGCPELLSEELKKARRKHLEEKIKSDDAYARKFLTDIEEMEKRWMPGYVKRIWG